MIESVSKPTLVYRKDPAGGMFFDDPAQTAAHRRIVEQLGHIALDVDSSRELIERIIDEYVT